MTDERLATIWYRPVVFFQPTDSTDVYHWRAVGWMAAPGAHAPAFHRWMVHQLADYLRRQDVDPAAGVWWGEIATEHR